MSAAPTVQGPPSTASPTLSTEPSSSLEAPQYNQPQHLEQSDPSAAPEPKELSTTPTPLPDIPVTNEGAEEGLSQESKGTEKVGAVGIDVEGSSESLEENVEDTDGAAQALAGVTLSESQRGSAGSGDSEHPKEELQELRPSDPVSQATPPNSSASKIVSTEEQQSTPAHPATRTQPREEREEEWLLKSIAWPPLPPRPASSATAQGFETSELRVKIIQQNRNGPCSLIALCNVLILRNDLHIAPGRDRVTYSYLSTLLADYFLRITSTPSAPPSPAVAQTTPTTLFAQSSTRQLSLEAALSILPQTQYGLNLNPQFLRIDGFTSSPNSGEGELALFSLAQIPLLHGWIADPSDQETYEVLKEAKDYDRAVEMMVEGSEVAGKLGLEGQGGIDLSEEELLKEAERRSQWTHEEEEKVRKAHLIDRFLNATSTQLTYPGLFALSSTPSLLPPSGLAALFRNSHLSVIYRRPRTPTPHSTPHQSPPGPELFTLVTDSSFAGENEIVWESIEDVDGSASEFFTAGLERSHVKGGDFAGVRNVRDLPDGARSGIREENEMADLALAQQLQAEEQHRADAYERAEQQRYEEEAQRDHATAPPPPIRASQSSSSRHQQGQGGRDSTAGGRHGEGRKSKAEKDKCLVM